MFCRRPSANRIARETAKGMTITLAQVRHAASMAALGIVPDDTYSEDECTLYAIFTMFKEDPNRFTDRKENSDD